MVSKAEAPDVPKNNIKEEKNAQQLSVESGVTSDEYQSPMNSICPSPEPKPEDSIQNNSKQEPVAGSGKEESENLINKEKSSQGEWILVGVNVALIVVYLSFLCLFYDHQTSLT